MEVPEDILVVAKQFLAGVPMKSLNFMLSTSHVDKLWQQSLLLSTVQNPLALKYPLHSSYQRLFLKTLMDKLEFHGVEVVEEIYELYASLLQSTDGEFSHRIYCVKPEVNVILKESTSLISQGTTGLVTWQAAKVMTEWCIENKDLLNGKNVLELGCGIGLTGIAVCKTCRPSRYHFTDCHPQVLDLLRLNLEINFQNSYDNLEAPACHENSTDIYHWESTLISLAPFHWDDDAADEAILRESKPDVILAADVIYDASIINSLLKVLKFFLINYAKDRRDDCCTAYIACTLRNEDTLNTFYEEAGRQGVQCEEVPNPETEIFFYEKNCPLKILKLFMKQ